MASSSSSPSVPRDDDNHDPFAFRPDRWILLSQGAEGRIWKIPSHNISKHNDRSHGDVTMIVAPTNNGNDNNHRHHRENHHNNNNNHNDDNTDSNDNNNNVGTMIAKERFTKKYRHPVLDEKLTKQRCKMEARILQKCHGSTLDVPVVYHVNYKNATLFLEYIDGVTVRQYLYDHQRKKKQQQNHNDDDNNNDDIVHHIAMSIGEAIHQLHYPFKMIHGDLTTSNMMIRDTSLRQYQEKQQQQRQRKQRNNKDDDDNRHPEISHHDDDVDDVITNRLNITLIDFGLAKHTESAEERAVDLYVLERALHSTHPEFMIIEEDDDRDDAYESNHDHHDDNDNDDNDDHDGKVANSSSTNDTDTKTHQSSVIVVSSSKKRDATFWQSFLVGYTRIPTTTTTTITTTTRPITSPRIDTTSTIGNDTIPHGEADVDNVVNDHHDDDDDMPMTNHDNCNKDHQPINSNIPDDMEDDVTMTIQEKRRIRKEENKKKKHNKMQNHDNDDDKNHNITEAIRATLHRLEQVRQRGRKRECFG